MIIVESIVYIVCIKKLYAVNMGLPKRRYKRDHVLEAHMYFHS